MGFDNECILNIQSLAGEYFCPVCRTLVYPNEALQTQCTHLYCKPCLAYIASSTQACPYDGYLVTEAGSKPLIENNKALAETIGKIVVHCLYHRSGCTWQGPLSECTTHCSGCAFGNSPVVCNRCGTQIVHRQVQEHAQTCNGTTLGTNPQPQQGPDNVQDAATTGAAVSIDQNKSGTQTGAPASQAQASQTAALPSTAQNLNQPLPPHAQAQPLPASALPTPEQWYQQQYQQYYQQYPGYDQYQQAYQQYYPYQQQATQQYQQPPPQVQGQAQSHSQAHQLQSQPQLQQQLQHPTHVQLQSQVQPHPQPQAQPQSHHPTQVQGQPQAQIQLQAQPQILSHGQPQQLHYPQAAVAATNQNQVLPQQQVHPGVQPHVPIQSQNLPPAHGNIPPQAYSQVQTQAVAQHAQLPQYQQPHPQTLHSQTQVPPHPQSQSQPPLQGQPQFQAHPQPHPQLQGPQAPQPPTSQHPAVQSVAGHHPYPPQPHQQIQQAPPQQYPMQVQPSTGSLPSSQVPGQFAQPPPHMRPLQPHHMLPSQGQAPGMPPAQPQIHPHGQPGHPVQQRPVMQQGQQPVHQQYVHQPQAFAGQASGPVQGHMHHPGHFVQQHSQVRPQGPPQPMQPPPFGYVQPQQGTASAHGMPPHSSQNYPTRPAGLMQVGQSLQFPQHSGATGMASHARPPHFSSSQPSVDQSNLSMVNQLHASSEQQIIQSATPVGAVVEKKGDQTSDRRVEQQEDRSPSRKKSETEANGFLANLNEVKPELGMNDEHKPPRAGEDNSKQDEALNKEAVSEVLQAQGVSGDTATTQGAKEEGNEIALVHSPGGKSVHNKVDPVKLEEVNVNAQGSGDVDKESQTVPPGNSQDSISGKDLAQRQSQTTPQGQIGEVSGGFQHPASLSDQGRYQHPPMPYGLPGTQPRPAAPSMSQAGAPPGQVPGQPPAHVRPPAHVQLPYPGQVANIAEHFQPPGPNLPSSFHPEYPGHAVPGSTAMMGRGPNFATHPKSFESQSAGAQGQYNQGPIASSLAGHTRASQGEPIGSGPLPRGPEGQTGPQHPIPIEADMYQNQRPPHFDSRRPDSNLPGNLERGPYGQPFGVESNSMRMNGAPRQGLDSSSAPVLYDEKFRTPTGERPDAFPMGPPRQADIKEGVLPFPRPPHLGSEASPKLGNSFSSRPIGAFGTDGPSRTLDKDVQGYNYDSKPRVDPGSVPSGFLPPYHSGLHPNESGGRPLPVGVHDDNRGRLDNNALNSDFLGPAHGFGRHHMDRLPPRITGREYIGNPSRPFGAPHGIGDVDGRERLPFGDRFPMLPPGHMRRGELDGPVNVRMGEHLRGDDIIGQDVPSNQMRRDEFLGPRNLAGRSHVGEPGFGSFQNFGRSGEPNGPGGFPRQQPFGDSFGMKSTHPRMGEPGFRTSYSRQEFPNDGGFYAGASNSFDNSRKRKSLSMGWCRICKVDCESVEGLDMHGQTREHQRMALEMVKSIKQKTAKMHKTSNDHSVREEGNKSRNTGMQGRSNKP